MERKISKQVRGYRTQDGAGVDLVRVLSRRTSEEYCIRRVKLNTLTA